MNRMSSSSSAGPSHDIPYTFNVPWRPEIYKPPSDNRHELPKADRTIIRLENLTELTSWTPLYSPFKRPDNSEVLIGHIASGITNVPINVTYNNNSWCYSVGSKVNLKHEYVIDTTVVVNKEMAPMPLKQESESTALILDDPVPGRCEVAGAAGGRRRRRGTSKRMKSRSRKSRVRR
jgi:hypothetical protein